YGPITVTVNGLTAASPASFCPTFNGNGSAISSSTFTNHATLAAQNGPSVSLIADFDGDGKPDLAVANFYSSSVSILRNLGTANNLVFSNQVVVATVPGNPYKM